MATQNSKIQCLFAQQTNMLMGYFELSINGDFIPRDLNPSAQTTFKSLGISVDQKLSVVDLSNESAQQLVLLLTGKLQNMLQVGATTQRFEVDLQIGDKLLWIDFNVELIKNETDTRVFAFLGQNVSDRHEQQEDMLQSIQRLDFALEGANDGLWDWNIETGHMYYSKRWCEMLGYKQSEVQPHVRFWRDSIHAEDLPIVNAVLRRHFAGETVFYETEHRVMAADGSWRWVLDRGKVTERSADDKPIRMTGINTDITRQKDLERTLVDRERQLRSLMKLAPIGIFQTDKRGQIIYVNDAWSQMTGIPQGRAKSSAWIEALHPEDTIAVCDLWFGAINKSGYFSAAFRFIKPDGQISTVDGRAVPLMDETGTVSGYIGTVLDITAQKEQEAKVNHHRANAMMNARLASLGEMAGGIAHEINTPLATIQLAANRAKEIIQKPDVNREEAIRNINKIENTLTRISTIIRGMRNFARNGSLDEPIPNKLREIVEDTLAICGERMRIQGIDLKLGKLPPELMLNCVATQISQVLLNLLNNAVDAVLDSNEKIITVDFSSFDNVLDIRVSDTGHGIAPQARDRIMEPFFTTKEPGKGTGLGLSISRSIMERHGGELINIDSDTGACFIMRFNEGVLCQAV